MSEEAEFEDDLIECWCGAKGTYEELFDDSGLSCGCGGTGSIACECGGDICVCHHHGQVECPGCVDCNHDDDGFEDGFYDEDE